MTSRVRERLQSAGKHRDMTVEEIASQIVVGVITRGNIDAALMLFHDHLIDRRAAIMSGRRLKRDPETALPRGTSAGLEV
jgi:hypothetical protein